MNQPSNSLILHLNQKNLLHSISTKLLLIHNAKYFFQLKVALMEFLRIMGCYNEQQQQQQLLLLNQKHLLQTTAGNTLSSAGGGINAANGVLHTLSSSQLGADDSPSQLGASINNNNATTPSIADTNSVDSFSDTHSTNTQQYHTAGAKSSHNLIFNHLDSNIGMQRDLEFWREMLIEKGCALIHNYHYAKLKHHNPGDDNTRTEHLRNVDNDRSCYHNPQLAGDVKIHILDHLLLDTSLVLDLEQNDSISGGRNPLSVSSSARKDIHKSKGLDEWMNRQLSDTTLNDETSPRIGVDGTLLHWNFSRIQRPAEHISTPTDLESPDDQTPESPSAPKVLLISHLIQHFIALLNTKCILTYTSLTKQNTLRDKSKFLTQMNICIALFLRIIEGMFLLLALSPKEHPLLDDWAISLDPLSNLCTEEWIHDNVKEWILDVIRAALLRKTIALGFIDGIGVGQMMALLRNKRSGLKVRCKCVQVICLLLKVAKLADEQREQGTQLYYDLVLERVGMYLGKKLAEEMRFIRFDEESFLSFVGRCDGRF
eukprot:CAMPEP_0117437712 /NCGR_PEP_ID=MMETSP0759-20121206/1672_1 /TAXON_ID=63605 /ORGANISM="Percolomonas cosmopolitus, Strain WS" /LENGTH=541 /DNA_ID=CAMNT_0005229367 /DNA_START=13 /DNA_END=1638 /DNA_ORIENTATION=-